MHEKKRNRHPVLKKTPKNPTFNVLYIIVYLKKLCTSDWLLSLKIYLCLLTPNCTQNHVSTNTYTNSYLMFCDSFQSLVARKTFQFHWNNFPEAFSQGRWESKYTSSIDNLWGRCFCILLAKLKRFKLRRSHTETFGNFCRTKRKQKEINNNNIFNTLIHWQKYFSFTLLHQ